MEIIYGLLGTEVNNGMFNADFTNSCRKDSEGNFIHSDVSLKYCFRNSWVTRYGLDSVLAYTKYDENLNPMTLEKNFESKFKIGKTKKDIEEQLLQYKDIKNFGVAFAIKGKNLSLTGPVQIGWGKNISPEASEKMVQIGSPFASPSKAKEGEDKKDKGQTTLGSQYLLENALFVAPVVVTLGENYTKEDLKEFIETSKTAVTTTQSRTMMGCNSAFSLFVKLENSVIATDLLSQRVTLLGDKLIFDFKGLNLKEVQLYVNTFKYEVEIINNSMEISVENIF
ncbi:MAG: type I CRISPR-associated protein Cas7 [Cetobacterium sp.]|uniref:type I CRISPR-associated protein Cas7 n=1 Tax=Cetobacterium sp. TaxID=2071632 RepID=UPI003F3A76A9